MLIPSKTLFLILGATSFFDGISFDGIFFEAEFAPTLSVIAGGGVRRLDCCVKFDSV